MNLKKEYHPCPNPMDLSLYEKSPYERARRQIVQKWIPNGIGMLAVDIGCGPGLFCNMLSDRAWQTTAVDLDISNLDKAKKWAPKTILGEAISVLSDLPSTSYDLVLALEIVEHMPKSYGQNLIKQIHRILKPGGRLLLSTPNRLSLEGLKDYYLHEKLLKHRKWYAWGTEDSHIYIYSSLEIIELLKKSGFYFDEIIGLWYETKSRFGRLRLPFQQTTLYPFNRFGFDINLNCIKSNRQSI